MMARDKLFTISDFDYLIPDYCLFSYIEMGGAFKIPYEDGSVYEGECLRDKPHGKGRLTYANGDIF